MVFVSFSAVFFLAPPPPRSLAYRLITGWVYYSRHPHGGLSGASSGHESDDLNDLSDGGAEGPQVTLPPGVTWAGDLVPQVAIDDGGFRLLACIPCSGSLLRSVCSALPRSALRLAVCRTADCSQCLSSACWKQFKIDAAGRMRVASCGRA